MSSKVHRLCSLHIHHIKHNGTTFQMLDECFPNQIHQPKRVFVTDLDKTHEFFQNPPPFFPTWLVGSPPIKVFFLNGLFQPYLKNVQITILIFSSPKTSLINMIISPILQISTFSLSFLSMNILSHFYFFILIYIMYIQFL